MNIPIKAIAEKSGFSRMTIWRVMNGKAKVSEETRQKINAAIQELSQEPKFPAILKAATRKKKIVMLSPTSNLNELSSSTQAWYSYCFRLALQKTAEIGYALEMIPISSRNSCIDIDWELFDDVGEGSMVLACSSWYLQMLTGLYQRKARIALLTGNSFWLDAFEPQVKNWVSFIYDFSGRLLLENYLAQGCRRIARAIWGCSMNEPSYPGICVYEEVLSRAGSDYRNLIVFDGKTSSTEIIRRAYEENPFDALVSNHTCTALARKESFQSLCGIPENVRCGCAWSIHPEPDFYCGCDRIAFDLEQMMGDAIVSLTAEEFVPRKQIYHGKLIPDSILHKPAD